MIYTKKDIQNLINHLKGYENTYEVLITFFEDHLNEDHFKFGLNDRGSQGSIQVINEMKNLFPDIWRALSMPKNKLPLFISQSADTIQEYPIACWRLEIDK